MVYANRPRTYGQTMVELALILGLVVVVAIGALQGVGGALKTAWGSNVKPEMEAPKGAKVAARAASESFAAITGTAGEEVAYELGSGGTSNWDGTKLQALDIGSNDNDAPEGQWCDPYAGPGEANAC